MQSHRQIIVVIEFNVCRVIECHKLNDGLFLAVEQIKVIIIDVNVYPSLEVIAIQLPSPIICRCTKHDNRTVPQAAISEE